MSKNNIWVEILCGIGPRLKIDLHDMSLKPKNEYSNEKIVIKINNFYKFLKERRNKEIDTLISSYSNVTRLIEVTIQEGLDTNQLLITNIHFSLYHSVYLLFQILRKISFWILHNFLILYTTFILFRHEYI